MRRKILSIFIVVLLVSLLLGCGGEETSTPTVITPIELVPQRANMIGYIDLSQIMEDEDIVGLYDIMPKEPDMPQTFDEALDLAREESALDLRDLREGLIFGDISEATGDMDYFAVVVGGTFDENELIESIESELDQASTPIDYEGYEIHIIYMDTAEEMGLAFLGSDAFVIGPMDSVKDVIAVKKGVQPAVGGKVLDAYNRLGDALVKVAMIVPPEAIEEGLQEFTGRLPIELPGLDALADLDTVGMTLTKDEQSIALDLGLCFTNKDSAKAVEGLISLAITMIGMIGVPEEVPAEIPIPQEGQELLLELLDRLEVSTTDSCLTISLELTLTEIEGLLAEYRGHQ